MEFSLTILLICLVAFFFAGFIDSVAGGAGFITAPSLLLCGVPPHLTLGTGKLATSLGSLAAVYTFWKRKLIYKRIAIQGFLLSLCGAFTGGKIALMVPSHTMGTVIVVMLPIAIILTFIGGKIKIQDGEIPTNWFWARVVLLCMACSLYEGFFGPGAGTFFMLSLHAFIKLDMVRASATSKVFNFAANFGAFCAFASQASVLYWIALPCAVASMIGNRFGASFAIKHGDEFVRKIVMIVLVLMICTLAYRYLSL